MPGDDPTGGLGSVLNDPEVAEAMKDPEVRRPSDFSRFPTLVCLIPKTGFAAGVQVFIG